MASRASRRRFTRNSVVDSGVSGGILAALDNNLSFINSVCSPITTRTSKHHDGSDDEDDFLESSKGSNSNEDQENHTVRKGKGKGKGVPDVVYGQDGGKDMSAISSKSFLSSSRKQPKRTNIVIASSSDDESNRDDDVISESEEEESSEEESVRLRKPIRRPARYSYLSMKDLRPNASLETHQQHAGGKSSESEDLGSDQLSSEVEFVDDDVAEEQDDCSGDYSPPGDGRHGDDSFITDNSDEDLVIDEDFDDDEEEPEWARRRRPGANDKCNYSRTEDRGTPPPKPKSEPSLNSDSLPLASTQERNDSLSASMDATDSEREEVAPNSGAVLSPALQPYTPSSKREKSPSVTPSGGQQSPESVAPMFPDSPVSELRSSQDNNDTPMTPNLGVDHAASEENANDFNPHGEGESMNKLEASPLGDTEDDVSLNRSAESKQGDADVSQLQSLVGVLNLTNYDKEEREAPVSSPTPAQHQSMEAVTYPSAGAALKLTSHHSEENHTPLHIVGSPSLVQYQSKETDTAPSAGGRDSPIHVSQSTVQPDVPLEEMPEESAAFGSLATTKPDNEKERFPSTPNHRWQNESLDDDLFLPNKSPVPLSALHNTPDLHIGQTGWEDDAMMPYDSFAQGPFTAPVSPMPGSTACIPNLEQTNADLSEERDGTDSVRLKHEGTKETPASSQTKLSPAKAYGFSPVEYHTMKPLENEAIDDINQKEVYELAQKTEYSYLQRELDGLEQPSTSHIYGNLAAAGLEDCPIKANLDRLDGIPVDITIDTGDECVNCDESKQDNVGDTVEYNHDSADNEKTTETEIGDNACNGHENAINNESAGERLSHAIATQDEANWSSADITEGPGNVDNGGDNDDETELDDEDIDTYTITSSCCYSVAQSPKAVEAHEEASVTSVGDHGVVVAVLDDDQSEDGDTEAIVEAVVIDEDSVSESAQDDACLEEDSVVTEGTIVTPQRLAFIGGRTQVEDITSTMQASANVLSPLQTPIKTENTVHVPPCAQNSLLNISNKTPMCRMSQRKDSTVAGTGQEKKASFVKRGKWTLGSKIGHGTFGTVYMCMTEAGTLMAAKQVPADKLVVDDIRREIELLKYLNHPNIVAYRGSEVKDSNLYIFQEWVPGGSVTCLLHKFGPFSTAVVRVYLKQVLLGLAFLHSRNILHRDIKGRSLV
jgi:Protein kinase domain